MHYFFKFFVIISLGWILIFKEIGKLIIFLILSPQKSDVPSESSLFTNSELSSKYLGRYFIADTNLRPYGYILQVKDGPRLDAISENGFVDMGDTVVCVRVSIGNLIVRKVYNPP